MGNTKNAALDAIMALPDDCTWEDIQYRFHVRASVESGLAAAATGDFLTHEVAKRKLDEWLLSSGLDRQFGTLSTSGT